MPVFISADSILHALHRSVDELLAEIERHALRSLLDAALSALVAELAARGAAGEASGVVADVDAYLAVAIALLRESPPTPVAGADPATVDELHALVMEASGLVRVTLFGSERDLDFSIFEPRGHYAVPDLAPYFRAMSWLSRIDLRPVFSDPRTRTRRVDRRQVACGLLLHELVSAGPRGAPLDQVDHVVGLILGERDGARPSELWDALSSAGITSRAEIEAAGETELLVVLEAIGAPRIASRVLSAGFWPDASVPLPVSVALVPPRYSVDAHVLSNLVFDRVGRGAIARMMPSTLDVAFAVFGNDDAARLLAPELERFEYASDLAAMRRSRRWVLLRRHLPLLALRAARSPLGRPRRTRCRSSRGPTRGGAACSTPSSLRGPSCVTTPCPTPRSRTPGPSAATTPTPTWSRRPSSFFAWR